MPNFDAPWWSIDDTVTWIASPNRSSLPKDYYWELHEFDDHAYFCGLHELVSALLGDVLQAHASVDTAPVAPVNASYWTSVSFFALWNDPTCGHSWPTILIVSKDPFRPEALLDHSERSNLTVSDAGDRSGILGYHRITTSTIFRRGEILKLWPAHVCAPLASAKPRTRRKGDLTTKVEQSLPKLTHEGLSLGQDRRGLSDVKIAQMLEELWYDEGDRWERPFDTIKKQVWRYYERLRTSAIA
jgi:hypothetical protein